MASSQQLRGRVAALRPGVDLHRRTALQTGAEDRLRVELRLPPRAPVAGDQPPGAVAEHVDEGVAHGRDHAPGHRLGVHLQLGVHRGHAYVEAAQHLLGLVQGAVVEDVDLDALQQPEASPVRGVVEVCIDRLDHLELAGQARDGEAVGDGEPGRVVGEDEVVVAELDRGEGHLLDRRTPVGPVAVGVQVAPQCGPDGATALDEGSADLLLELREPGRHPALHRRLDHLGRGRADAGQLAQGPLGHPLVHLVAERQDRLGRRPEGLDLVGLGPASLEQEGDPAQRCDRAAVIVRLRACHFRGHHVHDSSALDVIHSTRSGLHTLSTGFSTGSAQLGEDRWIPGHIRSAPRIDRIASLF